MMFTPGDAASHAQQSPPSHHQHIQLTPPQMQQSQQIQGHMAPSHHHPGATISSAPIQQQQQLQQMMMSPSGQMLHVQHAPQAQMQPVQPIHVMQQQNRGAPPQFYPQSMMIAPHSGSPGGVQQIMRQPSPPQAHVQQHQQLPQSHASHKYQPQQQQQQQQMRAGGGRGNSARYDNRNQSPPTQTRSLQPQTQSSLQQQQQQLPQQQQPRIWPGHLSSPPAPTVPPLGVPTSVWATPVVSRNAPPVSISSISGYTPSTLSTTSYITNNAISVSRGAVVSYDNIQVKLEPLHTNDSPSSPPTSHSHIQRFPPSSSLPSSISSPTSSVTAPSHGPVGTFAAAVAAAAAAAPNDNDSPLRGGSTVRVSRSRSTSSTREAAPGDDDAAAAATNTIDGTTISSLYQASHGSPASPPTPRRTVVAATLQKPVQLPSSAQVEMAPGDQQVPFPIHTTTTSTLTPSLSPSSAATSTTSSIYGNEVIAASIEPPSSPPPLESLPLSLSSTMSTLPSPSSSSLVPSRSPTSTPAPGETDIVEAMPTPSFVAIFPTPPIVADVVAVEPVLSSTSSMSSSSSSEVASTRFTPAFPLSQVSPSTGSYNALSAIFNTKRGKLPRVINGVSTSAVAAGMVTTPGSSSPIAPGTADVTATPTTTTTSQGSEKSQTLVSVTTPSTIDTNSNVNIDEGKSVIVPPPPTVATPPPPFEVSPLPSSNTSSQRELIDEDITESSIHPLPLVLSFAFHHDDAAGVMLIVAAREWRQMGSFWKFKFLEQQDNFRQLVNRVYEVIPSYTHMLCHALHSMILTNVIMVV
jgi:hypothetical protein